MGRTRTSVIFLSLLLGSATLALGQGFDPAAARSQIAPSVALHQGLAREMTVGTERLSRICDRTVAPVNEMPDLKELDAIEAATDTFRKESRGAYERQGSRVEANLKAHNASTEASGVCEKPEKNNKKKGVNYDAAACDQRNITKNNYALLATDLKILIELLNREVKAVDLAITLEAKRCIRGGFSAKLAGALRSPGPANHQSIAQSIKALLEPPTSGN
jgi:hypothetical protein